jgi:hypothetical protein
MKENGMSKTTRSRENVWIGTGAVRQHDGKLPLYICNACGSEVVWATSTKTGRVYLANVSHGYNGARYYVAANLHDCARVLAYRDQMDQARIDREIQEEDAHAAIYLMNMEERAHEAGAHVDVSLDCPECLFALRVAQREAAKAAEEGRCGHEACDGEPCQKPPRGAALSSIRAWDRAQSRAYAAKG